VCMGITMGVMGSWVLWSRVLLNNIYAALGLWVQI
jgi:hypothetical protein